MSRIQNIGNVLIVLASLMLIGSAATKLAHVPKVVAPLAAMGFDGRRLTLIAILEFICALLFLLKSTRPLGLLLASAYMGGAIATHVQHGSPIYQPSLVLFLIWLSTWLRHPQGLKHLAATENAKAN